MILFRHASVGHGRVQSFDAQYAQLLDRPAPESARRLPLMPLTQIDHMRHADIDEPLCVNRRERIAAGEQPLVQFVNLETQQPRCGIDAVVGIVKVNRLEPGRKAS